MFSIELGHNTSQTWLLNFGITNMGDIATTDVLVAIIGVLLELSILKRKCKRRKNRQKLHAAISSLAGDVVGMMNVTKGEPDTNQEKTPHKRTISMTKLLAGLKASKNN